MFMSKKGAPIHINVYVDGRWYSDKNDMSRRSRWLRTMFEAIVGMHVDTEAIPPGTYTFNVAEDSTLFKKNFDLKPV